MLKSAQQIAFNNDMMKRLIAQAIQSKYCVIRPIWDTDAKKAWGIYICTTDFCVCIPEAPFPIPRSERIHLRKPKAKGKIDPPPEFSLIRDLWETDAGLPPLARAVPEYDKVEKANVAIMRDGKPLVRVNFKARGVGGKSEHVFIEASLLANLEKLYEGNGGALGCSMMDGRPEHGPAGRRLLVLRVADIPVAMVYPTYPHQVQTTISQYLAKKGSGGGQKDKKPAEK
jgi:hypothetical protein